MAHRKIEPIPPPGPGRVSKKEIEVKEF